MLTHDRLDVQRARVSQSTSSASLRSIREPATASFTARYVLPAWFWIWAIFYVWTTACAVLNFGLRQPMFDEYNFYRTFLENPFPDNVLQSGNGHRPIFPNLLIAAEVRWLAGNHLIQFGVGLICAVLTCVLIALCVGRERTLSRAARAAGVMFGVLGIMWLGNGRMLLHSYESLHVYLLVLSISIAGLCTYEAWSRSSRGWLIHACAACVVAMFCFGSGVASFPAIILLGCVLGLPWRWLAIPAATLALCLFLYLYALPGDQGVRGVLSFHPVDSVLTAADWISSPWVGSWLGHAQPPMSPEMTEGLVHASVGPAIIASANGLQSLMGISWRSIARALGILGIATFLVRFALLALDRREKATRLQILASTFCLFALATAAVISLGRLDYFRQFPDQIYADRYMVWPSLFWAGLALLLLADTWRMRPRIAKTAGILFAIALPVALSPTQEVNAAWGSLVYRASQQVAAAARSDVFDGAIYPDGADASRADVLRSLALFKKDHLAMFSKPGWELVGTQWPGALERSDKIAADARLTTTLNDAETGMPAARIEGIVTHGIAKVRGKDQIAVLDENNTIVGVAEFSFIRTDAHVLRPDLPRKRGFDGYIRDYKPGRIYRVALLQPEAMRAVQLQELNPQPR